MKNSMVMVDSGAHSLYNKVQLSMINKGKDKIDWSYYESDKFWQYVDDYAEFIKANINQIDLYVNVDVIFNPALSWKVQKYLEDFHHLNPLPVIHSGTDIEWFKKYMTNHEYIGISGLGKLITKNEWMKIMGDPVFSLLCKAPSYEPTHKIHGFAITAPSLLARYPFYSVDSTSWIQFGKYGMVIIPRKKNGKYIYNVTPYMPFVTSREARKGDQAHFENFVGIHQDYFQEYFTEKGFKIGSSTFRTVDLVGYKITENEHWTNRKTGLVETIVELGLSNSHVLRDQLNTQFFLDIEKNLPPWPWSWKPKRVVKLLF